MKSGKRVELARKRLNLTQEDLGQAINSHQGTIARIENGKQSGVKHMPALAKILNVPLTWLTVGADQPEWVRQEQVRSIADEYSPDPTALDRIATAIERLAESVQIIDRRLIEKDERDQRRARERADLRKQMDRLQEEIRQQRKVAEP